MLGNAEMYAKPIKSLGQNFLKSEGIAIAEAEHSRGKTVIELGPGYGILTKQLCKRAKKVVAVEKDQNLYRLLKTEISSKKLKLINADFFDVSDADLDVKDADIMISNVPYNLSSKVIEWLLVHSMQAVLCLQKEFVEHMMAKEDTDKYSRLSVTTALCFSITKILSVPRGNFYPVPKVDSMVIYLKPKADLPTPKEIETISLLMQHKNKRLKNALLDSHGHLKMDKRKISQLLSGLEGELEERAVKLSPTRLLELSRKINKALQKE